MSRKAVLERTLGRKQAKKFIPKAPKKADFETVFLEMRPELVEQIVAQELAKLHADLKQDLKDRQAGKRISIFDHDRQVDISMIEGHLFAIETVLRYYVSPDELATLLPRESGLRKG